MNVNLRMQSQLNAININNKELYDDLLSIAESGFDYQNGCYFLKKLHLVETNAVENDFPDKTGYECFINSLSIDDFIDNDCLCQGILFIEKVFQSWIVAGVGSMLEAILSMDDCHVKVKIHMIRKGENYLSDDLDGFEEAILSITSIETIRSAINMLKK